MKCEFNPNICSVNCKKYPLCAYYSIQNQFSEVQSQLNFIYNTISEILKTSETAETKIKLLESAVSTHINDSYTNTNYNLKGVKYEKEDE
jgi:hypothetical protein